MGDGDVVRPVKRLICINDGQFSVETIVISLPEPWSQEHPKGY